MFHGLTAGCAERFCLSAVARRLQFPGCVALSAFEAAFLETKLKSLNEKAPPPTGESDLKQ
jgi:hypothetical protein